MEAGYDANGGLVLNLYPTSGANAATSDTSLISVIRYAGGQMTMFDQSGNPISPVLPNASIPIPSPLAFLGSNPGSSILTSLVVPNIQTHANAVNAQIAYSGGNAIATLTAPPATSGNNVWSYALSGSNWVAQSFSTTTSTATSTATRSMVFSNVNWSDNAINDSARAAIPVTLTTAPPPSSAPLPTSLGTPPADAPNSLSATVNPASCGTNQYALGGPQNVVMVHGLNSTGCAWTRMANWLNQDFRFGTELIPQLPANAPLATQGQDLANDMLATGATGNI